jgi:2-dehydropantoate 2-reductase
VGESTPAIDTVLALVKQREQMMKMAA